MTAELVVGSGIGFPVAAWVSGAYTVDRVPTMRARLALMPPMSGVPVAGSTTTRPTVSGGGWKRCGPGGDVAADLDRHVVARLPRAGLLTGGERRAERVYHGLKPECIVPGPCPHRIHAG
jgi:hypothetical protein